MQIGEVSAEITADVTEFNKALNKLQQDAIKFGNQIGVNLNKGISQTKPTGFQNFNKQLESVSKSMVKVGKDMTLKLTLPIVAAGTMATKTFADFELAMNRVAAISGATGNDLEKLTKRARDLGYTTEFSASQVAEAMGNLALAGFSVNEIYDASEGVLQLASSALLDMGTSASIASNVIRGYGIDISELNNAIDVLVKGFTSANMDLRMLGESLQYVGPIASSVGLSFNEVVAVIGKLSDAGIQGSQAGTTLRRVISELLDPTAEAKKRLQALGIEALDSNGKLKSLTDITRQFEKSGADTSDMLTIFGDRGALFSAVVEQGADSLEKLKIKLDDAGGTAERVSKTQMSGLTGVFRELQGAVEEVFLSFAKETLEEDVTRITNALKDYLVYISKVSPETKMFVTRCMEFIAVSGPVVDWLGKMGLALIGLEKTLPRIGSLFKWLGGIINSSLLAPILGFISAVGAAISYVKRLGEIYPAGLKPGNEIFGPNVNQQITGGLSWQLPAKKPQTSIPGMMVSPGSLGKPVMSEMEYILQKETAGAFKTKPISKKEIEDAIKEPIKEIEPELETLGEDLGVSLGGGIARGISDTSDDAAREAERLAREIEEKLNESKYRATRIFDTLESLTIDALRKRNEVNYKYNQELLKNFESTLNKQYEIQLENLNKEAELSEYFFKNEQSKINKYYSSLINSLNKEIEVRNKEREEINKQKVYQKYAEDDIEIENEWTKKITDIRDRYNSDLEKLNADEVNLRKSFNDKKIDLEKRLQERLSDIQDRILDKQINYNRKMEDLSIEEQEAREAFNKYLSTYDWTEKDLEEERQKLFKRLDEINLKRTREEEDYNREIEKLNIKKQEVIDSSNEEILNNELKFNEELKKINEDRVNLEFEYQQKLIENSVNINQKKQELLKRINEQIENDQYESWINQKQEQIKFIQDFLSGQNDFYNTLIENTNNRINREIEGLKKSNEAQSKIFDEQNEILKENYDKMNEDLVLQQEAQALILEDGQKNMLSILDTYTPNWREYGVSFGQRLIEGLTAGLSDSSLVLNKIDELTNQVISRIQTNFGISSPSKVFFEIGRNVIKGFEQGTKNESKNIFNVSFYSPEAINERIARNQLARLQRTMKGAYS